METVGDGTLTRRRRRALTPQIFDDVDANRRAITARARALPSQAGVICANRVAGGLWSAARRPDDWRSRLIAAAGGTNLLQDAEALPSGELTTESLTSRAEAANVWITESWSAKGWPHSATLNRVAAFKTDRVFHHQKRTLWNVGAFDRYETGAIRPDLILQDLAMLIHPDLCLPGELVFFDRQQRKAP